MLWVGNIMAAVWLIGSLYIYSEAGGSAVQEGDGQKAVRGRLAAPRESCWRKVERAERGRGGSRPGARIHFESFGTGPHFGPPH